MKREKRAGRSLGGGGIHSSGSLGDGAWQEGLKRREVSRSLAEARVLGGRGTQALRTRDSDGTKQSPSRSSIIRPGAHAQLSHPRLQLVGGKPARSRERGTRRETLRACAGRPAGLLRMGKGRWSFQAGT